MLEKLFLDELLGKLTPEDATDEPIEIDDSDIMGG
jgi:hypothetical protein